jgi:hypothetical protein
MSQPSTLAPYSADISVTFAGYPPYLGKVYVAGDGNRAVFDWPAQENTGKTFELAEFQTQTKWVTNDKGCIKSKFTDPDPCFAGMVSHEDYDCVSNEQGKTVYAAGGVTCTYQIDDAGREVIRSIVFTGASVEFSNVRPGPQDPALFQPPSDCKDSE